MTILQNTRNQQKRVNFLVSRLTKPLVFHLVQWQVESNGIDLPWQHNKGPIIIYRRGEGGGFGAKQGEIQPIPPLKCYSTEVIPPNNFWWLWRFPPRPPHMSSFSKQIWVVPPLNSSKVFSDLPFWVLSYDWSPFCSPKNQVIPLNSPPPPLPRR